MFDFEWLFFTQCLLGILMMIFLHKITQMKKQVDQITKEVKAYLTFIEGDTREEMEQEQLSVKAKRNENSEKRVIKSKDEAENHLIQTVLKEYFP